MKPPATPPAPVQPISRGRRRAAVLTVVATAVIWALAVVARWNPWGLVSLGSGLYGLAAAVTVLPLAGGALALLLVRTRAVAVTLAVVGAVGVVVAGCGAGGLALWADPARKRTVLASSPSGDYQVVRLTQDGLTAREELRIVRPAGPLTRQSTAPLVCVQAVWNNHPKIRVESARFVADHEVEVTLDDRTWRAAFDPDSLRPARTLDSDCQYSGGNVERVS